MNLEISRMMPRRNRHGLHAALCLGAALLLAGCSGSGTDDDSVVAPPPPDRVFAGDSGPVATIRRTTNGVAHISAENLESAAFGQGYAQAQDLVCYLDGKR